LFDPRERPLLEVGFEPYCDNGHERVVLGVIRAKNGGGWVASANLVQGNPDSPGLFVSGCPRCLAVFKHNETWITARMAMVIQSGADGVVALPSSIWA
jgi:hypothetical protein